MCKKLAYKVHYRVERLVDYREGVYAAAYRAVVVWQCRPCYESDIRLFVDKLGA